MTSDPLSENSTSAVYCGSGKAIAAATLAFADRLMTAEEVKGLTDAMIAMHHPDLGLDRSVCLRDVVEALRDGAKESYAAHGKLVPAADFIEREFGRSND